MFFRRRQPSLTATPRIWADPPALHAAYPSAYPMYPQTAPEPKPPPAAGAEAQSLHPIVNMFFQSALMLGLKACACLMLAVSAGMAAVGKAPNEIMAANLWLVCCVFAAIGASGGLQVIALNLNAVMAIRVAWLELVGGKDLNGDGVVGAVNLDAENSGVRRTRVIDLVNHNKAKAVREVIESGDVEIDRRDFLTFLHRAWESNGVKEQGTARIYWVGGRTEKGGLSPQYIFSRDDGTSQLCTREYYDAVVRKLESLGEIEARAPGLSGRLKRDPKEWLATTQWL